MRNIWTTRRWKTWAAWWLSAKYVFSKKKTGCETMVVAFTVDEGTETTTVMEVYSNVTDFQHHLAAETLSFYADCPITFRQNNVLKMKAVESDKPPPVSDKTTGVITRAYFVLGARAWTRYQFIHDYEYQTDAQAKANYKNEMDPNTIAVSLSSESVFGTKDRGL